MTADGLQSFGNTGVAQRCKETALPLVDIGQCPWSPAAFDSVLDDWKMVAYFIFCCCNEHHNQKQLGAERIYVVYTLGQSPSLKEVMAGTETENQ